MLEQVNYSMVWLKRQEANKRRQEEALERKRVSYTQVDWHNSVVVETVDYQPWEVGNPPTRRGGWSFNPQSRHSHISLSKSKLLVKL